MTVVNWRIPKFSVLQIGYLNNANNRHNSSKANIQKCISIDDSEKII